MKKFTDQQIVESWSKNVQPWINAVRKGEIESRLLVTNDAIVDAVLSREPVSILDVGCGEGWLVRECVNRGINVLGIDVVTEFVDASKKENVGRFRSLSYEDLSLDILNERFDVVVCNFSLLGNESVNHLFQRIPSLLNESGAFVVQTIHPVVACGDNHYEDGWREGNWIGFSGEFTDPAPWYFRTLESWQSLFALNGFKLIKIIEPMNPKTDLPASIIYIGEPGN